VIFAAINRKGEDIAVVQGEDGVRFMVILPRRLSAQDIGSDVIYQKEYLRQ